jgi:hypothetical protein
MNWVVIIWNPGAMHTQDRRYILNTGKHAGKVKRFKVNAGTEAKMTNEQRIRLIKDTTNYVDVNYN